MAFILALHTCAALVLALYALHQAVLLLLYLRVGGLAGSSTLAQFAPASNDVVSSSGAPGDGALPPLIVQLPLYNERYIARRVIDAAAALDYPRDRLHIQVLDDSTDDTIAIAGEAVRAARARGISIERIHRADRAGYKAGALANGLARRLARAGELVAIFDADFVPRPDFLRRVICVQSAFADPRTGYVQTRWDYLNRDESAITRGQALVLDVHFVIEQIARNRNGLPMAFNGSGGIWRRECIVDAGGWQADTLTEDLDLSYRAMLRGWRARYLPDETAPGELPRDVLSYKRQQARWARGTLQTVRKLAAPLLRSHLPVHKKLAGWMHLSGYFIHPLILLMTLTTPLLLLQSVLTPGWAPLYVNLVSALSIAPMISMAVASLARKRGLSGFLRDLPPALLLGVGVSFSNALSMARGLRTRESGEFVRTPKAAPASPQERYRLRPDWTMWIELALALYTICAIIVLAKSGNWVAVTPIALYAFGYGGVWLSQLRSLAAHHAPHPP
jgi:cellulose synthase/poly-beta-1,6-N-acetylglucosamine synthase-like glycosyltransferase